jgi:hypothetical protein
MLSTTAVFHREACIEPVEMTQRALFFAKEEEASRLRGSNSLTEPK